MNETYGYELLLNSGYEKKHIAFIESDKRAPDLEGTKMDEVALVEKQTINNSDLELKRLRKRPLKLRPVHHMMPATLIKKIESIIKTATEQLESYCGNARKRKIVLVLVSLDTDTRLGVELNRQVDTIESQYPGFEVVIKVIKGLD